MKHIGRKIAALFCTGMLLQSVPAAAAEEAPMAFRTALSRTYFTEAELQLGDAEIDGEVFIDHYTGMSSFKFVLEADAALRLSDTRFTEPAFFSNPGEGTTVNPEKFLFMFNGSENLAAGEVIGTGTVAVPGGSFGQFHVTVPQGTPAGVYKIGFRDGYLTNAVGQREYYFYAYKGSEELSPERIGCEVVVEPEPQRGDVNSDGAINLADAMGALMYHNSLNSLGVIPTDAETASFLGTPYIHTGLSAADVDGDGTVQFVDAEYILTYYNYADSLQSPRPWEEIIP